MKKITSSDFNYKTATGNGAKAIFKCKTNVLCYNKWKYECINTARSRRTISNTTDLSKDTIKNISNYQRNETNTNGDLITVEYKKRNTKNIWMARMPDKTKESSVKLNFTSLTRKSSDSRENKKYLNLGWKESKPLRKKKWNLSCENIGQMLRSESKENKNLNNSNYIRIIRKPLNSSVNKGRNNTNKNEKKTKVTSLSKANNKNHISIKFNKGMNKDLIKKNYTFHNPISRARASVVSSEISLKSQWTNHRTSPDKERNNSEGRYSNNGSISWNKEEKRMSKQDVSSKKRGLKLIIVSKRKELAMKGKRKNADLGKTARTSNAKELKHSELTSSNTPTTKKTNCSWSPAETQWEYLHQNLPTGSKQIHSYHAITKGGEHPKYKTKPNQDNYFILSDDMLSSKYKFFGVWDGHGSQGHLVSKYLQETLPQTFITQTFNNYEESTFLHQLLENVFIQTNSKLANNSKIDANFSGSTCCTVLFPIIPQTQSFKKIYIANVGDSRAIIVKRVNSIVIPEQLSRDHKPTLPDELSRIKRYGGRIARYKNIESSEEYGPYRVWLSTDNLPGLAMSRAFGDQIAGSIGVISDPEISEYNIKEEDIGWILGSDGLFEYVSNQRCCEIFNKHVKDKNVKKICEELYWEAYMKWTLQDNYIDDITIIVLWFS